MVALSTTEVEYVIMTEAYKELIWLKYFLKELGKEQKAPSLHSDNRSDLANNLVYYNKIKHIDMWYYFICKLLKHLNS